MQAIQIQNIQDVYNNLPSELQEKIDYEVKVGPYRHIMESMEKLVINHYDLILELHQLLKLHGRYYDLKRRMCRVRYSEFRDYINSLTELYNKISTISDDVYHCNYRDIDYAISCLKNKDNQPKCIAAKVRLSYSELLFEAFEYTVDHDEDSEYESDNDEEDSEYESDDE